MTAEGRHEGKGLGLRLDPNPTELHTDIGGGSFLHCGKKLKMMSRDDTGGRTNPLFYVEAFSST